MKLFELCEATLLVSIWFLCQWKKKQIDVFLSFNRIKYHLMSQADKFTEAEVRLSCGYRGQCFG